MAVFCRNIGIAAEIAAQTDLPVRFGRLSRDVDAFFGTRQLRIVFYVNQNLLNFQALRFPGPAHVHLSHGESEKVSMTSNQLKAYDEVFIAGDAARARIQRRLINMSTERLRSVGRPQLDQRIEPPGDWFPATERRTVFYAPTWEGDSPSMSYGSVARSGEEIIGSFVEAGWQVIYRPHPHTGINDPATRAAHDRIVQRLTEANGPPSPVESSHSARHYIDLGSRYGWQHAEADACVADMSAVAFDWLTSGKPLVMMEPSPGAAIDAGGLIGQVPLITSAGAGGIAAVVGQEVDGGDPRNLRELTSHYFGDTTPGAQIGRFIAESKRLIFERNRQLAEQGNASG